MAQRYLEFAAATAIASVAATVLAAQTPSARPEDGRDVTAVGCLKQERDIHGRMTTGSEAAKPGDAFVLMNARITSASMPEAPITRTGARAATARRPRSASGGRRRRGRRACRARAPAARGAPACSRPSVPRARRRAAARRRRIPRRCAGRRRCTRSSACPDTELTPLLGKEVEVRATLDANTMGSAAFRQPGATMGREPASTPSASTPPPEPTQAPATQADRRTRRPATARCPS